MSYTVMPAQPSEECNTAFHVTSPTKASVYLLVWEHIDRVHSLKLNALFNLMVCAVASICRPGIAISHLHYKLDKSFDFVALFKEILGCFWKGKVRVSLRLHSFWFWGEDEVGKLQHENKSFFMVGREEAHRCLQHSLWNEMWRYFSIKHAAHVKSCIWSQI